MTQVLTKGLGEFGGYKASEESETDRIGRIEYNAKAGRFYRVENFKVGETYENEKHEIRDNEFSAVFDLANIQVGWSYLAQGVAPSMIFADLGQPIPQQPDANHKRSLKFQLVLSKSCAGDGNPLRELMSSANSFRGAIEELRNEFIDGMIENPGKLPAVKVSKIIPLTNSFGTNYVPEFKIVGWVDRPAALSDAPAPAPAARAATSPASAAATPPATGSTASAAQPVSVDADDFG